jgi:hypothetical protein
VDDPVRGRLHAKLGTTGKRQNGSFMVASTVMVWLEEFGAMEISLSPGRLMGAFNAGVAVTHGAAEGFALGGRSTSWLTMRWGRVHRPVTCGYGLRHTGPDTRH